MPDKKAGLMLPLSPLLPCWKCGAPCWDNVPVIRPNGDAIVFTVCASCWEAQEFVNGKPAQVVIMPIFTATQSEVRS